MTWLEDLKAGDTVIIDSGVRYIPHSIATVEKVTATQIVLDDNCRYRKSDGRRMGELGSWVRKRLLEADPGKVRNIMRRELAAELTNLSGLTLEQLQLIRVWVNDAKEKAMEATPCHP